MRDVRSAICRTLLPSELITSIAPVVWKTMRRPSGDHEGCDAAPVKTVSKPLPSAEIV